MKNAKLAVLITALSAGAFSLGAHYHKKAIQKDLDAIATTMRLVDELLMWIPQGMEELEFEDFVKQYNEKLIFAQLAERAFD